MSDDTTSAASKGKGTPIPVRFEKDEEKYLSELSERSRISKSDLIRKAVTILLEEVKRRDGKVGWIADELGPEQKLIHLDRERMKTAMRNATAHGFVNFSDYLAWLIAQDGGPVQRPPATADPIYLRAAEDEPRKEK